jgi:hypothetical protein
MKLRQALRSSVAAITIASVAAPAGMAAPSAVAARGGPVVRVAQAKDFSRIEIAGARTFASREGQTLVLRLSSTTAPDISRLKIDPAQVAEGR